MLVHAGDAVCLSIRNIHSDTNKIQLSIALIGGQHLQTYWIPLLPLID